MAGRKPTPTPIQGTVTEIMAIIGSDPVDHSELARTCIKLMENLSQAKASDIGSLMELKALLGTWSPSKRTTDSDRVSPPEVVFLQKVLTKLDAGISDFVEREINAIDGQIAAITKIIASGDKKIKGYVGKSVIK